MFGSPVVTHPVCDLDLHQRIREARRDSVARSLGRRRPGLFGRVFRHHHGRLVDADAGVFRPSGEDVDHAFRF
jgi:hypothetical protein